MIPLVKGTSPPKKLVRWWIPQGDDDDDHHHDDDDDDDDDDPHHGEPPPKKSEKSLKIKFLAVSGPGTMLKRFLVKFSVFSPKEKFWVLQGPKLKLFYIFETTSFNICWSMARATFRKNQNFGFPASPKSIRPQKKV